MKKSPERNTFLGSKNCSQSYNCILFFLTILVSLEIVTSANSDLQRIRMEEDFEFGDDQVSVRFPVSVQ